LTAWRQCSTTCGLAVAIGATRAFIHRAQEQAALIDYQQETILVRLRNDVCCRINPFMRIPLLIGRHLKTLIPDGNFFKVAMRGMCCRGRARGAEIDVRELRRLR
jgi:hypothetical protein